MQLNLLPADLRAYNSAFQNRKSRTYCDLECVGTRFLFSQCEWAKVSLPHASPLAIGSVGLVLPCVLRAGEEDLSGVPNCLGG